MKSEVVEAKHALRAKLREMARQYSPAQREEASRAIVHRVQNEKVWQTANAVLLYIPVEGEPDVRPLIEAGLGAGKVIAVPRYETESAVYQVCRIGDLARDLAAGRYNIPEPAPHCPAVELNRLDLALAPGIGFTVDGCRLGRGKGYFDRMLREMRGWKCGVAFDWQVVLEIPAEPHDIRVDSIVTQTRWHVVPPAAAR